MREAIPEPSADDQTSGTPAPPHLGDAPTEAVAASAPGDESSLLGRDIVGRYRITQRLGAGGMGTVYRAEHLALTKSVAIKVVQPRYGDDPAIAQRFVQEARAASALGHEHIVQILDFGEMEGGGSFLVMEYLEGEDLAETSGARGRWPGSGSLTWARRSPALAAAHGHGIIHRDIKPANCLRIARTGDPDFIKILDFGLAKVTLGEPDERSLTHTGMLLGTPGYIAPELYRGRRADHRVDLYALGALMYKLLTGELPAGVSDDPALTRSGAPAPLRALIERCLSDDPERRHPTAGDLAVELRAIPRVAGDAPTLLAPLGAASSGEAERTRPSVPGPSERPPSGARESTPFSLVTVERDGDRVRFSFGLPALLLLVALVAGVMWAVLRGPPEVPVSSDMSPKTETTEPAESDAAESAGRHARRVRHREGVVGAPTEGAGEGSTGAGEAATTSVDEAATSTTTGATTTTTGGAAGASGSGTTATTSGGPEEAGDEGSKVVVPARDGPPTGSTAALRRHLRSCGSSLITAELKVQWRSDYDGRTIPSSVEVEVIEGAKSPALIDCVTERTRDNPFAWTPNRPREVLVSFGGK
ncbi:MAG: serine/threonine-protein kinase [Nannocystaceae bacterium]